MRAGSAAAVADLRGGADAAVAGLGHHVREELHHDAAGRGAADGDVEEHLRVGCHLAGIGRLGIGLGGVFLLVAAGCWIWVGGEGEVK